MSSSKRRRPTKPGTNPQTPETDDATPMPYLEPEEASPRQPQGARMEELPPQEPAPSAREQRPARPVYIAPETPQRAAPRGPQPPQPHQEPERIGDILRRVRESRGEALEDISDYLRIRPSYLVSLENSHFEQLPADAYVIGFLRTYANYLGLNGKAAIDQYRREMAGRRRKPMLSMPQPVPESRAPTIAILIGATLAALLLYAIWYAVASSDRAAVVPPLPEPTVLEEPAAPPPAEVVPAPTTPPSGPSPSGDSQSVAPVKDAPAKDAAAQQSQTPAVEQTKDAQQAPAPAPTAAPAPVAQGTSEQAPAATAQPVAKTPAADASLPKGRVFGPSGGSVVVRADKESWIAIDDARGRRIFDRVLKPGESYRVPQGKGLTLATGNSAGLLFNVGGNDLPKIVSDTHVVKDIPLDPEHLTSQLQGKDE